MLTNEAANALLKTLEEPPSHALFLLATTEPERLPATVLSRCQKYSVRPIDDKTIIDRMEEICQKEKIAQFQQAIDALDQENGVLFKAVCDFDKHHRHQEDEYPWIASEQYSMAWPNDVSLELKICREFNRNDQKDGSIVENFQVNFANFFQDEDDVSFFRSSRELECMLSRWWYSLDTWEKVKEAFRS